MIHDFIGAWVSTVMKADAISRVRIQIYLPYGIGFSLKTGLIEAMLSTSSEN
jgi:hypothetical protein